MAKKLLNIDLKFQPGSMLCWASCILMILEKFNTSKSVNYKKIINYYLLIDGAEENLDKDSLKDLNAKITYRTKDSFLDSRTNKSSAFWNIPIFNREEGNFIKYFESIFSEYHIFSNEDYKIGNPILTPRIAWDLIKKQINSKSPLILILSSISNDNSNELWHGVVVAGYWQRTENGKKENLIYVHDPLSEYPGEGESYSLNVNTLWNPNSTLKPQGLIFDFKSKKNLTKRGGINFINQGLFSPESKKVHKDLTIKKILT